MMTLKFEWDPAKAAKAELNLKEHGVSFDEATTVFRDSFSITISDPDHSDSERRFIGIGISHRMQLLVVSYTERKDKIRTISARRATPVERKNYEETDWTEAILGQGYDASRI